MGRVIKQQKNLLVYSRLVIKRAMFDKRDGLIEFITDLSKDRQKL